VPKLPAENVDAWLSELQVLRVYLAMPRRRLAFKQTDALLAQAPDALPALVARLVELSPEITDEGFDVRRKLLASYSDRSEVLHWSAHLSLVDQGYKVAEAFLDAAIEVGPVEPEMLYDRACLYALTGRTKAAIDELKVAIDAGYRNWRWFDQDSDLTSLRTQPEFIELMRTHGR
jgi:tetratricopeptide (TPR) repeat protein